jgi:hypothetical protein
LAWAQRWIAERFVPGRNELLLDIPLPKIRTYVTDFDWTGLTPFRSARPIGGGDGKGGRLEVSAADPETKEEFFI